MRSTHLGDRRVGCSTAGYRHHVCVCVCAGVNSRPNAPPYSAYYDRSGLSRARVHQPQYGGGFVRPVRTDRGCWWRAWGVVRSHDGITARPEPGTAAREREAAHAHADIISIQAHVLGWRAGSSVFSITRRGTATVLVSGMRRLRAGRAAKHEPSRSVTSGYAMR